MEAARPQAMNNEEALALLEHELSGYRDIAYVDLVSQVSKGPFVFERVGASGVTYQIEIEIIWDVRPSQNIHVFGSIDDGGFWSSFSPLNRGFLKTPDGSFVGE